MKNKVVNMSFAFILLSSSSLSVLLIFRCLPKIIDGSHGQRLYTFVVQLICPTLSIITALLTIISTFYTVKRYVILSSLLLSIMSIFGALMTCTITIFDTKWIDHFVIVQHILLLVVNSAVFISSVYVTIVATKQFHHLVRVSQTSQRLNESDLSKMVSVLSSILIISGGGGILGFSMGTTTLSGRPGTQLYWAGLHTGCFSITTGILAVICMYFCRHFRYQGMLITASAVNIITFVSSGSSLYTEELELEKNLKTYSQAERDVSAAVYNLILGKSCLVLLAAVINLVLLPSLQVCLLRHFHDSLADRVGSIREECALETCSGSAVNDFTQPMSTTIVPAGKPNMIPYQQYIYPGNQSTSYPIYNATPF